MEYLYLGKIVNTHGIKGEVRILSKFKFKKKALTKHFKIYIGKQKIEEVISGYRPHKQFDMITIEGIENINDVLKYKGKHVYIKKSDIILEKGEYFDDDLIGMKVIMDNEIKGFVERIDTDIYQDKIIVNKCGTLVKVPHVSGIIKDINLEEGIITLDSIKGLLD